MDLFIEYALHLSLKKLPEKSSPTILCHFVERSPPGTCTTNFLWQKLIPCRSKLECLSLSALSRLVRICRQGWSIPEWSPLLYSKLCSMPCLEHYSSVKVTDRYKRSSLLQRGIKSFIVQVPNYLCERFWLKNAI
jgi:hypothetical protein